MIILMTQFCLTVFLNDSDMGGPCHHILQVLTHGDLFLWGSLKDIVYKNNEHALEELEQEILVAVISVSEQIPASIVTLIADSHGCQWCMH
jgi:hypothetical protein